jgi:hypothetical protein
MEKYWSCGFVAATVASGTEIYDPATNTWTAAAASPVPRGGHSAILLTNGKVFVAGGATDQNSISALTTVTELYDPATNAWTTAASMPAPRIYMAMVQLLSGKVLVAGGIDFTYLPAQRTCSLYDPIADGWSTTGALNRERGHLPITLLPNGKALIIAGHEVPHVPPNDAEIYDPVTGQWTATTPSNAYRSFHTATLLANGSVITVGSTYHGNLGNSPQVYAPSTGAWTTLLPLTNSREQHTTTLLPNGKLLVAGGHHFSAGQDSLALTEIIDPSLGVGCSSPSQCLTGICVDGVCCDGSCAGNCDSCNLTGTLGKCTFRPSSSPGAPGCDPYLCSGSATSCPTSCASDDRCLSSHFCSAGACIPLGTGPTGTECRSSNQCVSGFCADGLCCSSACGNACDSCHLIGSLGTCVATPAGLPGVPACAPYLCAGIVTSCPTTCLTDSSCVASHRCSAGACVPKPANGTVCTGGSECFSGHCANGFCCNTACGADCDACDSQGNPGTCATSLAGRQGNPGCGYLCNGVSQTCPTGPCSGNAACASTHTCVSGACVPKFLDGLACMAAGQCTSGICADGRCCGSVCEPCAACNSLSSPGICSPVVKGTIGAPACAPYLCNGAASNCPQQCSITTDCDSASYCLSGACVARRAKGATCSGMDECGSRFCVDGFCCNTNCSGSCDACNLLNTRGTCTLIPAGSDGAPACSPYLCGTSASCPTACVNDNDCVTGIPCSSGVCALPSIPDAGPSDAGGTGGGTARPDAGGTVGPPSGCGCSSAGLTSPLFLLVLLAAARLRGRALSSFRAAGIQQG